MSAVAIVLLVLSAGTHAGWNLVGKGKTPGIATFAVAAGSFQALYFGALSGAYRHGALSLVYPIARSLPTILVLVGAVVLGRARSIGPLVPVGVAAIVAGSVMLPTRRGERPRRAEFLTPTLGFALLAAVGTTGYSMLDDAALRVARTAMPSVPSWQIATTYAFFEGLSTAVWLGGFVVVSRSRRAAVTNLLRSGPPAVRWPILMGAGIYLTYALVLVSMAFVRDVSYVVAFRQLSIPVGVVLSRVILGEEVPLRKEAGTALIFAGVVAVGLG